MIGMGSSKFSCFIRLFFGKCCGYDGGIGMHVVPGLEHVEVT